jgi:hypothetical protein
MRTHCWQTESRTAGQSRKALEEERAIWKAKVEQVAATKQEQLDTQRLRFEKDAASAGEAAQVRVADLKQTYGVRIEAVRKMPNFL